MHPFLPLPTESIPSKYITQTAWHNPWTPGASRTVVLAAALHATSNKASIIMTAPRRILSAHCGSAKFKLKLAFRHQLIDRLFFFLAHSMFQVLVAIAGICALPKVLCSACASTTPSCHWLVENYLCAFSLFHIIRTIPERWQSTRIYTKLVCPSTPPYA